MTCLNVGKMSFKRAGCQLFSLARCYVTGSLLAQLKPARVETDLISNLSELSVVYFVFALLPLQALDLFFYQIKTHPSDIYLL